MVRVCRDRLHKNMSKNIIIVLVLLSTSLIIFFDCQSQFIYFPDRKIIKTPENEGLSYESVYFETEDGVKISGWWIPSPKHRGIVLFCHGNAGNISNRLDSIRIFYGLGLSTFIFDYRGYGNSYGKPSEKGTYMDAAAAWNYLVRTRNISPDHIIIFGRSLGGSIACWLVQDHRPRMLIVESTFTTIREAANNLFPSFIVSLILRYKYSTIEYIKNVQCPILIIHSLDDELIPFDHGDKLYKLARVPKEFLKIYGSHNEGFLQSLELYQSGLNAFIYRHIAK